MTAPFTRSPALPGSEPAAVRYGFPGATARKRPEKISEQARAKAISAHRDEVQVAKSGALVHAVNCYYSSLIEGHDTNPVDIERTMQNDDSDEPRKRDLQLEARAQVTVQGWIDQGALAGRAATHAGICEIRRRSAEMLPDQLLWIEAPQNGERIRMEPGVGRNRDGIVGEHVAISPGAFPRFLDRSGQVHSKLGKAETTFPAAAAHPRLQWIYPFLDGNDVGTRLMA